MKLKISLQSDKLIKVPFGFSEYLQALVYNFLDRVSSEWLHETGFKYEKRTFKFFTFSSFLEKPEIIKKEKVFIFPDSVSFIISSPVDWIIKQVAQNIVISEKVRIGKNNLNVSGVEIIPDEKIEESKVRINALTPIEVHSTLEKKDGEKKTYYYSPSEKEFSEIVNNNLKKKWKALFDEDCLYDLKIEPVRIQFCKEQIRVFKKTVIKGYSGHYFIEGEPRFLEFAISAGLGSRNSGGFGMVEVVYK
ncbi:MAG: CRISPR-associated endoribonuclease Cas6 [Desulforegulaceae bacterium]|nr:CRISPR-associated endoribonuclease Cas6 [Desulforegulaceae bacterium]